MVSLRSHPREFMQIMTHLNGLWPCHEGVKPQMQSNAMIPHVQHRFWHPHSPRPTHTTQLAHLRNTGLPHLTRLIHNTCSTTHMTHTCQSTIQIPWHIDLQLTRLTHLLARLRQGRCGSWKMCQPCEMSSRGMRCVSRDEWVVWDVWFVQVVGHFSGKGDGGYRGWWRDVVGGVVAHVGGNHWCDMIRMTITLLSRPSLRVSPSCVHLCPLPLCWHIIGRSMVIVIGPDGMAW